LYEVAERHALVNYIRQPRVHVSGYWLIPSLALAALNNAYPI